MRFQGITHVVRGSDLCSGRRACIACCSAFSICRCHSTAIIVWCLTLPAASSPIDRGDGAARIARRRQYGRDIFAMIGLPDLATNGSGRRTAPR